MSTTPPKSDAAVACMQQAEFAAILSAMTDDQFKSFFKKALFEMRQHKKRDDPYKM